MAAWQKWTSVVNLGAQQAPGGGGAVCRWGTGVIIMCGEESSNSKNPDTVEWANTRLVYVCTHTFALRMDLASPTLWVNTTRQLDKINNIISIGISEKLKGRKYWWITHRADTELHMMTTGMDLTSNSCGNYQLIVRCVQFFWNFKRKCHFNMISTLKVHNVFPKVTF